MHDDDFDTFAVVSENEDPAISNITLSGNGSASKGQVKKKCEFAIVYFLQNANATPCFFALTATVF